MGFPSPAMDYVEQRISLDQRFIIRLILTRHFRTAFVS